MDLKTFGGRAWQASDVVRLWWTFDILRGRRRLCVICLMVEVCVCLYVWWHYWYLDHRLVFYCIVSMEEEHGPISVYSQTEVAGDVWRPAQLTSTFPSTYRVEWQSDILLATCSFFMVIVPGLEQWVDGEPGIVPRLEPQVLYDIWWGVTCRPCPWQFIYIVSQERRWWRRLCCCLVTLYQRLCVCAFPSLWPIPPIGPVETGQQATLLLWRKTLCDDACCETVTLIPTDYSGGEACGLYCWEWCVARKRHLTLGGPGGKPRRPANVYSARQVTCLAWYYYSLYYSPVFVPSIHMYCTILIHLSAIYSRQSLLMPCVIFDDRLLVVCGWWETGNTPSDMWLLCLSGGRSSGYSGCV